MYFEKGHSPNFLRCRCFKICIFSDSLQVAKRSIMTKRGNFLSSTERKPFTHQTLSLMSTIFLTLRKVAFILPVSLLVDNGPDYSKASLKNLLFYVRLWRDLGLEVLFVGSYAANDSALNPIEHAWSPLSKALISVVLRLSTDAMNDGRTFDTLTDVEKALVLDRAAETLDCYWRGLKCGGFPISSTHVKGMELRGKYQDYDEIFKVIDKGINSTRNSTFLEELEFSMSHVDRRIDCLIIKKCDSFDCTHCSVHPKRAAPVFAFLRQNPTFPTPVPNPNLKGHFHNLTDYLDGSVSITEDPEISMSRFKEAKASLPTVRCSICPAYTFRSKADRSFHVSVFHYNRTKRRKC